MQQFKCWVLEHTEDESFEQSADNIYDAVKQFAHWSDQQGDGVMIGGTQKIAVRYCDPICSSVVHIFDVRAKAFKDYYISREVLVGNEWRESAKAMPPTGTLVAVNYDRRWYPKNYLQMEYHDGCWWWGDNAIHSNNSPTHWKFIDGDGE